MIPAKLHSKLIHSDYSIDRLIYITCLSADLLVCVYEWINDMCLYAYVHHETCCRTESNFVELIVCLLFLLYEFWDWNLSQHAVVTGALLLCHLSGF